MASSRSVKPWSVADLRQRCRSIRAALGEHGTASDAEIRAYWPGGAENAQSGRGAWIFCFANYVRLLGRTEERRSEASMAEIDAAIARRSAAAPQPVRLTSGRTVAVYPKAYHALRYLDWLDAGLAAAGRLAATAQEQENAEALAVIRKLPLAESLSVRVWAWILTTEGPGLPFRDDATDVVTPEWLETLTALDLVQLHRAHRTVNHDDISLIALAFPSDPRQSRLPLSGFLNTYAQEAGQRPLDVFRQFSMGEVFASAVSTAQAAREARENADSQQER